VVPGQPAPDFELPRADGLGTLRLSDLRGRPVLLHFGSFT
jgi:peroxiredoxin